MTDKPYSDLLGQPDARLVLCDELRAALNRIAGELGKVQPYYLTHGLTEQLHEVVRSIGNAQAALRRINKRTRDNRSGRRGKRKAKQTDKA